MLSQKYKDGNYFFNCLSQAITGNQNRNMVIRTKIIENARQHYQIFNPMCAGNSLESYINDSGMHLEGTWATDFEIIIASHLFQIDINIFTNNEWLFFKSNFLAKNRDSTTAINLNLEHDHSEINESICEDNLNQRTLSGKKKKKQT